MADDFDPEDESLEGELQEELEDELDEELEEDLEDEAFVADDELLGEVEAVEEEEEEAAAPVAPARPEKRGAHGDEDEDEEDDFDADDVEEDLDTILKDRIAAGTEEDEEDEDVALDSEDRTNSANRVQPKRPEEFVCQSCFLVKHPSQLADAKHQLCADCV